MSASTPIANDHPLKKAWDEYRATDDYANSKNWAMRIAPMVQASDPNREQAMLWSLMPVEQREGHVEGSLWAAFMAGYAAAGGKITSDPSPQPTSDES